MAKQPIGIGSSLNDGTGDTVRDAFDKCNDNFTELYDEKAPLASPTFTGTPAAPTASAGTSTTQIATTAFVATAIASPSVIAPTLLNSWVNFGSGNKAAGYRKLTNGMVVLEGTIKSGTDGQPIMTLPAGYRPSASLRFACWGDSGAFLVLVTTTGSVTPSGADTSRSSLDGICFLAD